MLYVCTVICDLCDLSQRNCDLYLQAEATITSYESPDIQRFYKTLQDVT